ncbi:MAG: 3'-5' exonuclease, partial [Candidatus Cloacimonetes bacterium]|nr:3'-5' exonuclease [Candidatus Cloacimonadota bacterium]
IFGPSTKIINLVDKLKEVDIPAVYLRNSDHHDFHESVKISTLHSAKGLEFRVVILLDIEKDLLNFKCLDEKLKYQTAAKLLYVGMTRAYDSLIFMIQDNCESNPLLEEIFESKHSF